MVVISIKAAGHQNQEAMAVDCHELSQCGLSVVAVAWPMVQNRHRSLAQTTDIIAAVTQDPELGHRKNQTVPKKSSSLKGVVPGGDRGSRVI